MSRKRFEIGLISDELYQAMKDVAESEEISMASLARQTLEEKFLLPEPVAGGGDIRVFALSDAQIKRLLGNIPVVGQVVDDDRLGNRVEMFEEVGR